MGSGEAGASHRGRKCGDEARRRRSRRDREAEAGRNGRKRSDEVRGSHGTRDGTNAVNGSEETRKRQATMEEKGGEHAGNVIFVRNAYR